MNETKQAYSECFLFIVLSTYSESEFHETRDTHVSRSNTSFRLFHMYRTFLLEKKRSSVPSCKQNDRSLVEQHRADFLHFGGLKPRQKGVVIQKISYFWSIIRISVFIETKKYMCTCI